ncbi:hypothetical protein BN2537_1537 [Streptomyces venezuelae]|nr:hypothetical protein BN2537_1537 [Streptomyces venezuelae]
MAAAAMRARPVRLRMCCSLFDLDDVVGQFYGAPGEPRVSVRLTAG